MGGIPRSSLPFAKRCQGSPGNFGGSRSLDGRQVTPEPAANPGSPGNFGGSRSLDGRQVTPEPAANPGSTRRRQAVEQSRAAAALSAWVPGEQILLSMALGAAGRRFFPHRPRSSPCTTMRLLCTSAPHWGPDANVVPFTPPTIGCLSPTPLTSAYAPSSKLSSLTSVPTS
ncbi:hypothetical protein GW7_02058 [Heterocephalus glaber]|uniref:Uncharacterized protein n=1 Tax=Heterocephalus glaber TaxID=10181 RepID=G5AMU0_HETGA|nr:hypothetical protein GW7_02058 [Heterocephalus glaber]